MKREEESPYKRGIGGIRQKISVPISKRVFKNHKGSVPFAAMKSDWNREKKVGKKISDGKKIEKKFKKLETSK